MTPQDQIILHRWMASRDNLPTIVLAPGEEQDGSALAEYCDQLQKQAPGLTVKKDTDESFQAPAIIIGPNRNIAFQAVPAGKLLEPFLSALSPADPPPDAPAGSGEKRLAQLRHPLQLKLYVAMQCPHCPKVVSALLPLAAASALVRLTVIDAQMFGRKAAADQVKSVPTLIMDDHYRWTGQVDTAEIVKLGIERDPSSMSADSLKQILEAGEAPRAAAMMMEQGKVFPALMDLLTHSHWSVRLGAMVTVEYLAEEAPDLTADLARSLWQRFEDLSDQVQGDVVHVLSLSPSPAAKAYLKSIAKGPYDQEVVEAAREALE
ncbi:MAG: thioredoxin family protein [Desulfosarcinaceae bacterium]